MSKESRIVEAGQHLEHEKWNVDHYKRLLEQVNDGCPVSAQLDLIIDNNRRGSKRIYLFKDEVKVVLEKRIEISTAAVATLQKTFDDLVSGQKL
jgi:hypothetical protein